MSTFRRVVQAVAVGAVATVLLAGCGAPAPPPLEPRQVAAPVVDDPAQPCVREAPAADAGVAPPAAPIGLDVRFDRATNVIDVVGGTGVTLPAIAAEVGDPAALREVNPGEWLLGADLVVRGGAELQITTPEVRWLKLSSEPGRFVSVDALGGKLDVTGSCVTSWNDAQGSVDTAYDDGRSFLLARDGAQMTIDHAELHYLGHGDVESYGLSWRTAGTGGGITDSIVSNLYYGLYTYEVSGLSVLDNEFRNNVLYGIDPHTGSAKLDIERNVVHDNGKHGIILAEDCVDSVIRDNLVYRNAHHGIVLYLRSDRNLVEGNETFDNSAQGININESGANTLRDNKVYDNGETGVGVTQLAQGNVVEGNQLRGNQQDGLRVVSESAATTVHDNVIAGNARYGLYVDTSGAVEVAGNTITDNASGIMSTGAPVAPANANDVSGNKQADVVEDKG
ncbi:right-handed parallel beta-helix repeat-containing protein [Pseudonocardia cypriaca]|uniref:Parallel beta-helix repeat protein n=1 Tax=Pseudonocardia cypriaca TaxID=882449 RepID=A0A543FUI2_9PSEU|nr:right-handed parallel beta-helix repeat-containing protein [Pseudonocardia cypriaca]TQM37394.1 parallel beta-helix repeat protein [Pseudonocardia cypriaca]